MDIKRKFDETLSGGHGKQLIWLLAIISSVVASLVFVGYVAYGRKGFDFMEMMSLFLDPGNVKGEVDGAGGYYAFRLIATLLGIFLMSALLISVVSNMFENISDSYRNGTSRYKHSNHVLILGAGHQLIGILKTLSEKSCKLYGKDIVVLSNGDIEELRKNIFGKFEKSTDSSFLSNVTFYYGDRSNPTTLQTIHPDKACCIYIIGEEHEENHDHVSIKSLEKISKICEQTTSAIRCFLVLNSRSSIDVYRYEDKQCKGNLKVDVIDENEYMAECVLVSDHDGKEVVHYPKIDYRGCFMDSDGIYKQEQGILPETEKNIHIVIAGMTNVAKEMAITSANISHFPNYRDGRYRTKITFIAKGIRSHMNKFTSRYENLFMLSNYSYLSFDDEGSAHRRTFVPNELYGDFLDIEWEFIEGELVDTNIRPLLQKWANDNTQSLSICICLPSQEENTATALSLPKEIYCPEKCIPIFVHQEKEGNLIIQARKTKQYGRIFAFGMSSELQDDPLYENERGKRVNFLYDQLYVGSSNILEAWTKLKEAHKLSSIYSADSVFIKMRSFGITQDNPDITKLTDKDLELLNEVEHRRWMTSVLFLGYWPMTKEARADLISRKYGDNPKVAAEAKAEFKDLKEHFIHPDITPFQNLPEDERRKDDLIIRNIPYIIGKSDMYSL